MKRIISLFLALCLLAGCGLAAAEDRVPEGKPWINSNVLGNLPDERPAVEDGFDLYVNYDAYTEARDKGTEAHAALDETDVAGREKTFELCRSATAEYPEDEILRILYGLLTDTEKRDTDGLAPLMAKVDRVKAAETTDDLLALLQEGGFMPCDTFYAFSIETGDDGSGKVYIRILRKDLLEEMLPAEGEPGELYEGSRIPNQRRPRSCACSTAKRKPRPWRSA